MEIVENEGSLPVFDIDILNTLFRKLLKLPPDSRVKSAQIYQPRRAQAATMHKSTEKKVAVDLWVTFLR